MTPEAAGDDGEGGIPPVPVGLGGVGAAVAAGSAGEVSPAGAILGANGERVTRN